MISPSDFNDQVAPDQHGFVRRIVVLGGGTAGFLCALAPKVLLVPRQALVLGSAAVR